MTGDDGLMRLVQRALQEPEFLRQALADPVATLQASGIRLQPTELAAVKEFAARMAAQTPAEAAAALQTAVGQRSGIV